MNYLIDFSLFYYKCGDLYKDTELKFSYYTDLDISNLQDIIRQMINMFTDICNQLNYFDKLTEKEHNFHSLEIQHKKKYRIIIWSKSNSRMNSTTYFRLWFYLST